MSAFDDSRGCGASPSHWWNRAVVFPRLWALFGQQQPVRWCTVDDFGALVTVWPV